MVSDEDAVNLHPIERIIRVELGALLLYFGSKVGVITALLLSGYYKTGTLKFYFAKTVSAMPNVWRVLGWTLGFIFIFTGANGFCPFYKILKINTNVLRKKSNR